MEETLLLEAHILHLSHDTYKYMMNKVFDWRIKEVYVNKLAWLVQSQQKSQCSCIIYYSRAGVLLVCDK